MSDDLFEAWRKIADNTDGPPTITMSRSTLRQLLDNLACPHVATDEGTNFF